MSDRSGSIKKEELTAAIEDESRKFHTNYLWLEKAMPPLFFEEISRENVFLVVHNLLGFSLLDYFSTIHLKNSVLVMCLDSADADLRILQGYAFYGIKSYQTYISSTPPPFPHITANLRIAAIYFTEAMETAELPFPGASMEKLRALVKQRNPQLADQGFNQLISSTSSRFLRSLPIEQLILAIDMFFRAQTRDNCQYEVRYNQNWQEEGAASMHLILAWKNTPKHNFLYRMALVIHRHQLVMKSVNATYMNPYSQENILVMALSLHGNEGKAAWDQANIIDFLRELLTVKYFASFDAIEEALVNKGIISGTMGNFLRSLCPLCPSSLVHVDINLFTMEVVEEALCRHPELTIKLCEAFQFKFDPEACDFEAYLKLRGQFLSDLEKLDTGQEENDTRRKTILQMGCISSTYSENQFLPH